MSVEEKMSLNERYKYLRKMQQRYRQASRKEKGALLDEMAAVTEMHRKSLVRLMQGTLTRQPRRRERGSTYGPDVAAAVVGIAESLDWVCAERVQPALGWMADQLMAHGELTVTPAVREKLDRVSVSTVRRLLALPNAAPGSTQNVYLTLFDPPEFMKGEDGLVTFSNERTMPVR